MKDIDNKLDTIVNLVKDKEKPVTKSEMEELIGASSKEKDESTYRQVSEKPVVVDVMNISEAAAKKLADMMSGNQQIVASPVETVDGKKESTSIIGKLLGFAKDIFLKILGALGKVVGWVIGTLTSLLKQLSSWILKKIQTAMAMAVTRSMGGMGGRFRRAGLISAAFKLGAGALAAKAAYDMFQGFDKVESQLDNINTQTQSMFSDPESMISSGMASAPDFTAFGSGGDSAVAGDDGLSDSGTGPDEDEEDEDESEEDELTDDEDIEPESPLGNISVENTFPMDELDQQFEQAQSEEIKRVQEDSTPPMTSDPEAAGKDLQESVGMFKDAEAITPSDADGKKIAKLLNDGVTTMNEDLNIKVAGGSPAGGSSAGGSSGGGSSGGGSSRGGGSSGSMPSKSTTSSISSPTSKPIIKEPYPGFYEEESARDQMMDMSGLFKQDETQVPAAGEAQGMVPEVNKANINIENLVNEAQKTNKSMSELQSQTTSPSSSGSSKSPSSKKSFTGSVSPSIGKPPASAPGKPGAAATSISPPTPPPGGQSHALRSSKDQLTEKMAALSDSLREKPMNIVQKTETKSETVVDFVSSTDGIRAQTRNNGVSR